MASVALAYAAAAALGARQPRPAGAVGSVTLTLDQCPARWEWEIGRALEDEIGDRLAAATDPTPTAATGAATEAAFAAKQVTNQLIVNCDGTRAAVVAKNPTTDRHLERTFAATELPDATAPRIVALAGLELLATLDPELRRAREEAQRPVDIAPVGPRLRVFGGGVYRTFATAPSGVRTWGAELGVDRSIGELFVVSGGAEVGRGGRTVSLGEMTALLGSGSLAGGVRFGGGDLQAVVEAGARGGAAHLSGKTAAKDVVAYAVTRPWAGPFVAARAFVDYRRLCFDVSLESGATVIGANGLVNDLPALVARGVWLGAAVGVGIRL